ncbi:pancreatic triacylglycerol lipase [Procambarus clarkii]|uniref:pancreatic triacylglycerol lipase n=1 Tax=Procambarus clarkii TaxID=6728 RepID=UPI0037447FB2
MLFSLLLILVMDVIGLWDAHASDAANTVPIYPQVHSTQTLGNLSDIRFLLWTRTNPDNNDYYRLLPRDFENLDQSPFNASLPTYFMYHGFSDFGECQWILNTKTELLGLYECNVVSVDWQTLVLSPWYNLAVENVYKTANYTAAFIDWLHSVRRLAPSLVHITGHSLGAHTAGLTARYVTSGTVARVTGLDPAGPLFYDKPADQRLDSSDADFVDVLHANSGSLAEGCIALHQPLGHVDFYPNGGRHQPGCVVTPEDVLTDWIDLFGGCSHARVTELWVESLIDLAPDKMFTSWPCSDWDTFLAGNCSSCGQGCLHMGFHVEYSSRGSYYLRTNATSPFALGDNQ